MLATACDWGMQRWWGDVVDYKGIQWAVHHWVVGFRAVAGMQWSTVPQSGWQTPCHQHMCASRFGLSCFDLLARTLQVQLVDKLLGVSLLAPQVTKLRGSLARWFGLLERYPRFLKLGWEMVCIGNPGQQKRHVFFLRAQDYKTSKPCVSRRRTFLRDISLSNVEINRETRQESMQSSTCFEWML